MKGRSEVHRKENQPVSGRVCGAREARDEEIGGVDGRDAHLVELWVQGGSARVSGRVGEGIPGRTANSW